MHSTMAFGVAVAALFLCSAGAMAAESAGSSLRASICLNGMWETAPATEELRMPDAGWKPTRTPALPLSEDGHPKALWYRLSLDVPADWGRPGRRFGIEFEKVGHYAAVFCNGVQVGEHYGQFAPFEIDLTPAFRPGERNTIAVYVHDASGEYVRPGADVTDPTVGPSYRPGAQGEAARNWIGIVGDVTLDWRPAAGVSDVLVVPSVRKKSLEARIDLNREAVAKGVTCRAAVLDGDKVILELPAQPAAEHVTLAAPWADPVLWGPPPYGVPKLYELRTELVQDGRVLDRAFTRFGFREVWVDGQDVLLNGRKLWMVGTYSAWLAPSRYINDRRPMAAEIRAMQAAGLNTLNGHWDSLGRTYLDLADEMGMFVWSSMYCNSQLPFQPNADAGWADFMVGQAREWAHAVRNHPSVMAYRPFCGAPKNLGTLTREQDFRMAVDRAVRAEDGTRPLGDRTDIYDFNQGSKNAAGAYDDASGLARVLKTAGKPVMTVEIWTGFNDVEGMTGFFRNLYQTAYAGGETGFIPQHLPFFKSVEFKPSWLSLSGPGNRDLDWRVRQRMLNWCDPSQPADETEPYGRLFAELYREHTGRASESYSGEQPPEVLVSGAPVGTVVFMGPAVAAMGCLQGLLTAPDGTAWFVLPRAGAYELTAGGAEQAVQVAPQSGVPQPGYDYVQRVSLGSD